MDTTRYQLRTLTHYYKLVSQNCMSCSNTLVALSELSFRAFVCRLTPLRTAAAAKVARLSAGP